MKCSVSFLVLAFCGVTALAQSTSTAPKAAVTPSTPSTSAPASPAASGLQPRGPEAVAREEPNKVIATLNGKQITAKEAADLINSLPPQDRKRYENNLQQLVQQIFMDDQIAGDAVKENLDQKPPYKQQLQINRDGILAQAYLASLINNPTAAENAKQYFDAHPSDFDQVKVSGIVIAFNAPGTPANSSITSRTENDAQAKAWISKRRSKRVAIFRLWRAPTPISSKPRPKAETWVALSWSTAISRRKSRALLQSCSRAKYLSRLKLTAAISS